MQERAAFRSVTQRVTNCVPTQRVGTRKKYLDAYLFPFPLGRDKTRHALSLLPKLTFLVFISRWQLLSSALNLV